VLLLVSVAVLATGTESAASVAPDWPTAAPSPSDDSSVVGASAPPAPVPMVDASALSVTKRVRWTWPLLPRPPVVARFDAPDVRWGSGHRGVDLAASVGQDVLAPTDGVVSFRGVLVDRGVLVIETAGGLRTTFEPVDSELAVGTPVVQGQRVATVAATPGHCAPATCLHWGVLRGETYLDPLSFVGAVRVVLLPLRPP
jgi:murein DD-endopeptidase MepM/ murein hydrolase activator NlpD